LREEHKLHMLRKIFGPKKDEVSSLVYYIIRNFVTDRSPSIVMRL